MTGIHRGDSNMSLRLPGFSSLPALPSSCHETSTEFQLWWCSSDSWRFRTAKGSTWCFSLGAPRRTDQISQFSEGQSVQAVELMIPVCGDWPSIQWGLRTLRFRSLRTKLEFIASQYLIPKLRHEIIFKWKNSLIAGSSVSRWTWIKLDAMFSTRSHPTRECIWFQCSLRRKKKR